MVQDKIYTLEIWMVKELGSDRIKERKERDIHALIPQRAVIYIYTVG